MKTPVAIMALLLAAGCGFEGVQSLPLPGGADLGHNPREVTIEFADALDLVPHSLCKLNDVTVGKVTAIELAAGWRAEVTCTVRADAALPAGTGAAISQTSLLGEKFVKLVPAGAGSLNGRIPLSRTTQTAEVEQVLAAASLLVNGGGLEQLATINTELGAMLDGRTGTVRNLLRRLDAFAAALDGSKGDIVRLIGNLDRLTATLAAQRQTLRAVATDIGPAVKQLRRQRADLTRMLTALARLGRTATRVVTRSQDDTLANLAHLRALLADLDRARHELAANLGTALTFPFPGSATGLLRGDYGNVDVTVDLTPSTTLDNFLGRSPR
ncbi:MCE family protein [Nonomuraea endophytica]|uniref:Phospholipid/cholesterol/gamma-HCH transport system substrate-binding protein n=1 Tax=Nonomuraea endophytica TaxID=714136 RepID=A0A7W7ZWN6_9ACTN|nr:MCE family protein [Nonomuraea endophytica]MBB5075133.1 phospholipid/cholesterol/gamma-HCH transport system substrate-binding protein [Nonomuraea endophytica]